MQAGSLWPDVAGVFLAWFTGRGIAAWRGSLDDAASSHAASSHGILQ